MMPNRSEKRSLFAAQLQSERRSVSITLKTSFALATLATSLVSPFWGAEPASADAFTPYCQQISAAIAEKDRLRPEAIRGNKEAQKKYKALLSQHGERLKRCRNQMWPQNQAIWIRLYPCDVKPGVLDAVLDRIVDRGYNQVYVEVFYNGKVLLPSNQNPTPWPAVLSGSNADNEDLLAQAIQKGRARGLKVYAWLFGLNFGANYVRRFDRQQAVSRNGSGQTSLTANLVAGLSTDLGLTNPDEAFIDPYNLQARQDYDGLIAAVSQRKPDGILIDYIRYPRGYGSASVASKVQDLWIYGESSQQALLQRAGNAGGATLLQRFLSQGFIKPEDVRETTKLYPQERTALWQGIDPIPLSSSLISAQLVSKLQNDLWRLTVAHAAQGVIDFATNGVANIRSQGIPAGLVFFPDGNATVGRGFDSRLQLWDRFPPYAEWHPMAYGVCGHTGCIMQQIQRVLSQAPNSTEVKPVLAGVWQQSVSNRPPLEAQMQVLRAMAPQIKTVSHFAYSWQEPGSDRDRKACAVR